MENNLIKLWFALTWMANQLLNELPPPKEEVGKQNVDSVYSSLLAALGMIYKKKHTHKKNQNKKNPMISQKKLAHL